MTTTTGAPQVWVGCLACYNAGNLVGQWIDADEAGDLTPEELHGRPTSHEELWVFDFQDFHGFLDGECSPMEAQRIAERMTEAEEDGIDLDALGAYLSHVGGTFDEDYDFDDFRDHFHGEFESVEDYARSFADDIGAFKIEGRYGGDSVDVEDRWPFDCIDWSQAARNLGVWTVTTKDYNVYVFSD